MNITITLTENESNSHSIIIDEDTLNSTIGSTLDEIDTLTALTNIMDKLRETVYHQLMTRKPS